MFPTCVHFEGHTFLVATLADGAPCLDLGFNYGNFARFVAERFGCPIIAFEPVPELVEAAPNIAGLTLTQAAVGGEDGNATVQVFENRCASFYASEGVVHGSEAQVPVYSLKTALDRFEAPEIGLAKVDIEGAEFDLLLKADRDTLRRVRQYTVEFHDFMWPERAADVDRVFGVMRDAGFHPIRFSRDNTNVVFLRADCEGAGFIDRLWLTGPVKYAMGFARLLKKRHRRRSLAIS